MKIQESTENYLETILILSRKSPYARFIGIANELAFSKPSVSVAVKNLRGNGYILMDDQGHITPSSVGREIAEAMYEHHTMLSQWLIYLGVDGQTIAEDACRIKHMVSVENFRTIKDRVAGGHGLPEDNL